MLEINKLYPQYNIIQERRQQRTAVPFERRSGIDRRAADRVKLDTTLTRDIFQIKNTVAQLPQLPQLPITAAKKVEPKALAQRTDKALQHSVNGDQFVRTTKQEKTDSPKEIAKSKSEAGTLAGVLGVMLGGTLAATFLGAAGIGLAVGLGVYFGGKMLRSAIISHLKNR